MRSIGAQRNDFQPILAVSRVQKLSFKYCPHVFMYVEVAGLKAATGVTSIVCR